MVSVAVDDAKAWENMVFHANAIKDLAGNIELPALP